MTTGYFWALEGSGGLSRALVVPGTLGGASLPGGDFEGPRPPRADTASKMACTLALQFLILSPFSKKQPTRQLPVARIATPNVFVPCVCEIPQRHRSSPT